ncbi:MAG: phosphoribosyltransferase [Candidatus Thorarchaeota archaeon]|jgi:hypoxanthine phosphoribosyltransferase
MAITYEFVWWERFYELCFRLYLKIVNSGFIPDVIVGVARGGWVPARILSDLFFTKETANVKVDLYRGIYAREPEPKVSQSMPLDMQWECPLLVDDIADTGDSLIAAMKHLEDRGYKNLRTATLHLKPWSSLVPNFYIVKTEAWVVYPWELKEFTYDLASQFSKNGKSPNEIESQLFAVGVPMHYAQLFLKQWQKTEANKVLA